MPSVFLVSDDWQYDHKKTYWYTVYMINNWCFRRLQDTVSEYNAHEDVVYF